MHRRGSPVLVPQSAKTATADPRVLIRMVVLTVRCLSLRPPSTMPPGTEEVLISARMREPAVGERWQAETAYVDMYA
jgi:hypothetical protein